MHSSPQKGPETLLAMFQGIRRSQGICYSRTSFLSVPIPILPDRNGIQEKESNKKIPEVGGAHTYFRNKACGYWECGLACSAGLDRVNGMFQFYVKASTRHPKLPASLYPQRKRARIRELFTPIPAMLHSQLESFFSCSWMLACE